MNSGGGGGVLGGTGMMMTSAFTVSQWQELEHQALIYKYMMAGLPVPSDLMLPIHKSFQSLSQNLFQNPTMGYCSFYGKKVDPEPGRCRRTDGKKWRCAKDAYHDSKYCERHMHRGRSTRSRKPVESSQTSTQSSSSVTASSTVSGTPTGSGSFRNIPAHAFTNPQSTNVVGTNTSSFNLDSIPFGIPSQDYRYLQGLKPEAGEHSFLSETSRNNRGLQMDNLWPVMKSSESSISQNDYQHQHSFLGSDYASGEPARQEGHNSLRPFFNEWPKARDSWSNLEDNQSSISTTQLSMASSGLSRTNSQSPHDN